MLLSLINNRGRLLGWTNIKKSLKFSLFKVIEKRTKKERYTIVSIG